MTSFRLPSVKATLRPDIGLKDAANILQNKPRSEEAMMGKAPPVPNVPPPPTIEDAQGRAQDEGGRLRRRKGRAASVLTSGNAGSPMTASKTLLGA